MSCAICERSYCAYWMHSAAEQERYSDVITADMAIRILRNQKRAEDWSERAKEIARTEEQP